MMNQRIRELAKESDLDWHKHWEDDDESNRLEKFAELIVRECAQVCVEVGDANSDIYPEFGNGAYFSANRVKEHFGVEE